MVPLGTFWETLIGWYHENGRSFPWRNTANAFHVLVAELLLQRTHVRKVEEVYTQLIEDYPTPQKLAGANPSELENVIAPIGLRYRASRLKECARLIVTRFKGDIPNHSDGLRTLPGVGPYISDAVLCYAFNHRTVPIDANVIRLFCRYQGLIPSKTRAREDPNLLAAIRGSFSSFDSTMIPNLAVLDFSGLVCRPRKPLCGECLLNSKCKHVNLLA